MADDVLTSKGLYTGAVEAGLLHRLLATITMPMKMKMKAPARARYHVVFPDAAR